LKLDLKKAYDCINWDIFKIVVIIISFWPTYY